MTFSSFLKILNEHKNSLSKIIAGNKSLLLESLLILLSFVISIVFVCEGDLTLYSGSQILKFLSIATLLSISVHLTIHSHEWVIKTISHYWQRQVLFIVTVNFLLCPLLFLSHKDRLFAFKLPTLTAITSLTFLALVNLSPLLWQRLLTFKREKKDQSKPEFAAIPTPLYRVKATTVLINGLSNGIIEYLLPVLLAGSTKKVVLIDSQMDVLESWHYWLRQFYPDVTVITTLSDTLTETSLSSLFTTYKPQLIFDLDRCFYTAKAEGAIATIACRNLHLPRLIIENAIAIKAKALVTLSPQAQTRDELIHSCQLIQECYAQKMDSAKTRIIPIRCYPLAGDTSLANFLTKHLHHETKDIILSDDEVVANLMLTILQQLLTNPAHHGSVWAVTAVKRICSSVIRSFYDPSLSYRQFHKLVDEVISNQKIEELKHKDWLEVSLDNVAIINDCTIIEADFEEGLITLSKALKEKDEIEINNILKVA